MKTLSSLRFIALFLMAYLMLPTTMFAQLKNDYFFCVDDAFINRTDYTLSFNITNNTFETPLGGGLLVLAAVGAGYAVAKRRRNRGNGMRLILALAMMLAMTGCKKDIVEPIVNQGSSGTTYTISLNTGKGSRVNVTDGVVEFTEYDKLIVAYDGKYAGTLYCDGSAFVGTITLDINGEQPLYFYFLGNKDTGDLTPGTTTGCTVNISDQTKELPVISFSASDRNFDGSGSYSAALNNKCSLIKFNVTTSSDASVYIKGMNNKVTVNFADNAISYDKEGEGIIRMKAKDGDNNTIAVVLPQGALDAGEVGSAYTLGYKGCRPALPEIGENTYIGYSTPVAMTINTEDTSRTLDLSTVTDHTTVEDCWAVTGTLGGNYKISIADGATVTLNGVTINGVDDYNCQWEGLNCIGDATLILADGTTNTIKGFYRGYAGIHVNSANTLTIQGTGALNASSHGGGAGIGGNGAGDCGHIIINGGTITAICDNTYTPAAGIGCAVTGNCMGITINGGEVTATGAHDAAGIGSANGSSNGQSICYSITINGGTVKAFGGRSAAGIGSSNSMEGGILASACNSITITDGTVIAEGGSGAAGIGSGVINSTCGNITITGGTVIAIGGKGDGGFGGAGIGTGNASRCGNITIDNTVTLVMATMGSGAINSIGIGSNSEFYPESPAVCGTVTIGGTVYWDGSAYQNGGDSYLIRSTLIYPAP